MALDVLQNGQCTFYGPALPEPFVRLELEKQLKKHDLLPAARAEGLADRYEVLRRKLRKVTSNSGPVAIRNRVVEPFVERLGYGSLKRADDVVTREGEEDGGYLMDTPDGAKLRCWTTEFESDLDAPKRRGHAYRYSPVRVAQRVLLACGERVGLVTNGTQLRLLLCDPARPDSEIGFDLEYWRKERKPPDGYRLLLALGSPAGVAALPEIIEQARLQQTKVTKELRTQAREAVEAFIQYVLDHPDNQQAIAAHTDRAALAKDLWHEGLVLVYRLLFVLKCESTHDPSRVFKFAGTSMWRKTYSPTRALAPVVRSLLDESAQTGHYLEQGLRVLFKIFAEGMELPGLTVRPLGGVLFGAQSTPLLSSLTWGEQAVARLLDKLLWTTPRRRNQSRERVHYGPLDVEDLGRVYESLLELEPGITSEPMCRLKRAKLEVVVPLEQGERYRDPENAGGSSGTTVRWIEEIPPDRFYLRVGLGRKASGSYYTPHSFVRFLVQETLGPQCDERSPRDDPQPSNILKLKVLDPACGSGHFLVEACRYLAGRLYEAVRLCDELASNAEDAADEEADEGRKHELHERAREYRKRIIDLPDERDELLDYLPSRSEGAEDGSLSSFANARAEAICRRLVAVHCIYGVDINPLAVELAKLSLWIESHAEGYPLTFLDHRIVLGNSLTGPFAKDLIKSPGSQQPVQNLFSQNLDRSLAERLRQCLNLVRHLEASVGTDAADIARKAELKRELDEKLLPFRVVAAAWAGGVMLGTDQPDGRPRCDDDEYAELLRHVGQQGALPERIESADLRAMIAKGLGVREIPVETESFALAMTGRADAQNVPVALRVIVPALSYDLAFAEVFHPTGIPHGLHGFDAVLGNPPWDTIVVSEKEFGSAYDPRFLESRGRETRSLLTELYAANPSVERRLDVLRRDTAGERKLKEQLAYDRLGDARVQIGHSDDFQVFACRGHQFCVGRGRVGFVLPAAFCSGEPAAACRFTLLVQCTPTAVIGVSNLRRYFDIAPVAKFCLVSSIKAPPPANATCRARFQVDDFGSVMSDMDWRLGVEYPLELVFRATGPLYMMFEISDNQRLELLRALYGAASSNVGTLMTSCEIQFVQEFNVTSRDDATEAITLTGSREIAKTEAFINSTISSGKAILVEAKTFYAFSWMYAGRDGSGWDPNPRKLVRLADVGPMALRCRYYRLALRRTVGSIETNDRSLVATILPAGSIVANSAVVEAIPHARTSASALALAAFFNAFVQDLVARTLVVANLNDFLLRALPAPNVLPIAFLAHCALRITCDSSVFSLLWHEQLGDNWRELGRAQYTWPVLEGDDARWAVRAAIDAVVADAYGLSREQYAHVLSTFSHSSYPRAPELCLTAFDELKEIGLEEFCKRHDPYWDIPLNDSLPQPVIDLPIPEAPDKKNDGGPLFRRAGEPGTSTKPNAAKPKRSRRAKTVPDPGRVKSMQTLLELKKELTTSQAAKILNLKAAEAKQLLDHLVDNKQATKKGQGRGTRYVWGSK